MVFKIRELGFLEDRVEIKSHSVKTIDGSVEHHSRVGEQRCMSQAAASAAPDEQRCMSQATRIASEPTWASTDLLEVIEEVPYHELFFPKLHGHGNTAIFEKLRHDTVGTRRLNN